MNKNSIPVSYLCDVFTAVLDLLLPAGYGATKITGGFVTPNKKKYNWKAYRYEHLVGPPTIRIDLREEI